MKGKISRGKGFAGAVGYVLEKEGAELIGGTMSGTDKQTLVREFSVTKALRPGAKSPVWHCSLSAAPGEHYSSQKWNDLAHDFMQRMGYDPANNQYIIGRHSDTDKDHIHIVASRIGLDGKLWLGRHDVKQMIKHTQELEQVHGLTITPGLSYDDDHKTGLTRGEIEKAVKISEAPAKLVLQTAIDDALQGNPDNPDTGAFIERLEAAGISVRPNLASTGRCSGLSFELDGAVYKASQLGKSYGFGQLQKRGLDYDQVRDLAALKAAAERSIESETTAKPGPSSGPRREFKKTLDLAFRADKDGVYRWGNHKTVAFVDYGDHITLRGRSATAVKAMVQLGQQNGWQSIIFKAHDTGMAAEMYRQARLAGYPPESISFDRTGPNAAQIEQIEREVIEREQSRSSQVTRDTAQQSSQPADRGAAAAPDAERRELGTADRAAGPESGGPVGRGAGVDHQDRTDSGPAPAADRRSSQRRSGQMGDGSEERQQRAASLTVSDQADHSQRRPSGPAAPGRDVESLDSSDQHRDADSAGSGERIRDLAAPVVNRGPASPQGVSPAERDTTATDPRDRAAAVAPHIKAKLQAWSEQHAALQAPGYRLTLTARAEGLRTYNHGKQPDGSEQFYTAREIAELIPQLSRHNARGYDIYITPIDPRRHYVVLDDTNPDRLRMMQERTGIKPALVQQSSPGNLQAVIIADRQEGRHEQSNANYLVQSLNKAYGDPKFTGVVHPFRLSGFMNQKPAYEQGGRRPITRPRPGVVELSTGPDVTLNAMMQQQRHQQQQAEAQAASRQIEQEQQRRAAQIEAGPTTQGGADARYIAEAAAICAHVASKGWPQDWSRIDYMAAGRMLKDTSYSQQQIADAIKLNSPGIDDRKQNPDYYARQTVSAAAKDPRFEHERELDGPRMS